MNARLLAFASILVFASAGCGGHGSVPPASSSQPSGRHTQVWQTGSGTSLEQFAVPSNIEAFSPIAGSNGTVYFIDYSYTTSQLALANVGYRGAIHVFAPPSPQPSLQPQLAATTGILYGADSTHNAIYSINEKTGVFTSLPVSGVSSPSSPVYKGGFLYFYNNTTSGAVLEKVSLKYLTTTQFPAPAYGFAGTVGPDGNIYSIESGGTALLQFNVQTHAFQQFPAPSGWCLAGNLQPDNSSYYGADPIASFNGALYVTYENPCGSYSGGVAKVTTSGTYTDLSLDSLAGQGLGFGKDGYLYATTGGVNVGWTSIWQISASGTISGLQGDDFDLPNAAPFAVGGDGNLWFLPLSAPTNPPGPPVTANVYLWILYALTVSPQNVNLSLSGTASQTVSVSEAESGGTITAKSSNVSVATVSGAAPTFTVKAVGAGNAILTIQDQKHNVVDVVVQVTP